jgi:hypothetical protein
LELHLAFSLGFGPLAAGLGLGLGAGFSVAAGAVLGDGLALVRLAYVLDVLVVVIVVIVFSVCVVAAFALAAFEEVGERPSLGLILLLCCFAFLCSFVRFPGTLLLMATLVLATGAGRRLGWLGLLGLLVQDRRGDPSLRLGSGWARTGACLRVGAGTVTEAWG